MHLLLLLSQVAAAQDQTGWTAEDLAAMAEIRMADLGIEPVYADDGESYSYALPAGLETEEYLTEGALIWAYDGQYVFTADSGPTSGEVSALVASEHLTDISHDADAYLGVGEMVRVDEYGRRWILSGYDENALWDAMDAYDALVEKTFGLERGRQDRVGVEYNPDAGKVETSTLDVDVWDLDDCTGGSDPEIEDHVSGGTTSPLAAVSSPNVRQKKTVLIMGVTHSTGNQYMGSGVMVDDDTVLTAAHVIAGSTGYTDAVNLRVCTYGNVYSGADCQSVSALAAPGGVYDGTTANDYAVITLDADWSPSRGWMAMSVAGDSTLDAATHYHEGYPAWETDCTGANTTFSDSLTVQDGSYLGANYATMELQLYDYFGAWIWTAYGPTLDTPTGYVKFKVSSGGGMSGGPYYYCPDGCTETAGAHFVTAITHGHNTSGTVYTSGAKARDFRDWVIANM